MTGCQVPAGAVENGLSLSTAAVGVFFRVRSGGRFHRRCRARGAKVTDDIGRFDDESR